MTKEPHSFASLIRWLVPLFLFLGGGCATIGPSEPPPPLEAEDFETVESGFHISVREGTVRYQATLDVTSPLDQPRFLDIRYENPEDPQNPHRELLQLDPGTDQLRLESPPLRGLEAGRFYWIEIEIFDDPAATEPLDRHEIRIYSTIDTRRHGR